MLIFIGALIITLIYFTALGAILFFSAGTLAIPMFWAYLISMILLSCITLLLIQYRSPGLIKERLKPGKGEKDNITLKSINLLYPAHLIIAGLDIGRYHWLYPVPFGMQIIGLILLVAGYLVITWTMLENPFFSSAVRIQSDRNHHLIQTGPYKYIRHPGYAGGTVFLMMSGFALGSLTSVIPMVVIVLLFIRRTLLEEKMLKNELPGYQEYMLKVRYRWIPNIW